MPLFEFELAEVSGIHWNDPDGLNWFALSQGLFRVNAGEQVLFEYSEEILRHWNEASAERFADYFIAAFARDVLACVAPGMAVLPAGVERLASDWDALVRLKAESRKREDEEFWYTAWRWLGERSPWMSYLVARPDFSFVRIGDDVVVAWDNRERQIDGIPVWTAQNGRYAMPAEAFRAECRDFADRLLQVMSDRIDGIEAGLLHPGEKVDVPSVRKQHEAWRTELARYFEQREPDISWEETEDALRAIKAQG